MADTDTMNWGTELFVSSNFKVIYLANDPSYILNLFLVSMGTIFQLKNCQCFTFDVREERIVLEKRLHRWCYFCVRTVALVFATVAKPVLSLFSAVWPHIVQV